MYFPILHTFSMLFQVFIFLKTYQNKLEATLTSRNFFEVKTKKPVIFHWVTKTADTTGESKITSGCLYRQTSCAKKHLAKPGSYAILQTT